MSEEDPQGEKDSPGQANRPGYKIRKAPAGFGHGAHADGAPAVHVGGASERERSVVPDPVAAAIRRSGFWASVLSLPVLLLAVVYLVAHVNGFVKYPPPTLRGLILSVLFACGILYVFASLGLRLRRLASEAREISRTGSYHHVVAVLREQAGIFRFAGIIVAICLLLAALFVGVVSLAAILA